MKSVIDLCHTVLCIFSYNKLEINNIYYKKMKYKQYPEMTGATGVSLRPLGFKASTVVDKRVPYPGVSRPLSLSRYLILKKNRENQRNHVVRRLDRNEVPFQIVTFGTSERN